MKFTPFPTLKMIAGGDGRRGYFWQKLRDTCNDGVFVDIMRESYSKACVESWWFAGLPVKKFASYQALAAAVEAADDSAIAAELAKYPQIRSASGPHSFDGISTCSLCREPATSLLYVATCWTPGNDVAVLLCEEHAHLKDDPKALMAKLNDRATAAPSPPAPQETTRST